MRGTGFFSDFFFRCQIKERKRVGLRALWSAGGALFPRCNHCPVVQGSHVYASLYREDHRLVCTETLGEKFLLTVRFTMRTVCRTPRFGISLVPRAFTMHIAPQILWCFFSRYVLIGMVSVPGFRGRLPSVPRSLHRPPPISRPMPLGQSIGGARRPTRGSVPAHPRTVSPPSLSLRRWPRASSHWGACVRKGAVAG